MGAPSFQFMKWGLLTDGVIDLEVVEGKSSGPAEDWVPGYKFEIRPHGQLEKAGRITLRIGTPQEHPTLLTIGHIGFAVEAPHRGHGYAGRACRLVVQVARAHGLRSLLLTLEPGNAPSKRTCERIGARLVGVFDVPPDHPLYAKGSHRMVRFEWAIG